MKPRVFSGTLLAIGQDLPSMWLQMADDWLLAECNRFSGAAERGGTENNRHLQFAAEKESTSAQAFKKEMLAALGWDQQAPTFRYNLVIKELTLRPNSGTSLL